MRDSDDGEEWGLWDGQCERTALQDLQGRPRPADQVLPRRGASRRSGDHPRRLTRGVAADAHKPAAPPVVRHAAHEYTNALLVVNRD